MKIAILTQPLGHNYGGIMQAWALQKILKRMGHDPITIDRRSNSRSFLHRVTNAARRTILNPIRYGSLAPKNEISVDTKNTRRFIQEEIKMSPMFVNSAQLSDHFKKSNYDVAIVGSDQTWRPAYSPNLKNFYLDFLHSQIIKKIAYASSFGVDQWELGPLETKQCALLAQSFDFISVREKSGVNLCEKHLGVKADVALDPTLLLTHDDYRKLIDNKNRSSSDTGGLYVFLLDRTPEKNAVSQKISRELGLKIFTHDAVPYEIGDAPIQKYTMPTVHDWLSGFERADYIVTDSYHGMLFSIIFNKPFLVFENDFRGASRFSSLLEQLDLEGKMINRFNIDSLPDFTPTPTASINKLKKLREESISKLTNYIN
ncbi:polysaccharide pyruvyl transferase family protein [Hydrogenophaga taeniospiralis]|uniref:polysaccharide pyruvyl transferase family protein n=1 Tax=Hydrogenophaga taeniospiralis TaxID=65656 RepID=UPI001CFB6AD7|nr:polysaccharide pyruvyl transferase family protein [Hydrogenophaga taeniospiralis]UCU92211.1 polysaccharide pyruvyl transferase family protein [Hydrogenophaga taeniospiralis]